MHHFHDFLLLAVKSHSDAAAEGGRTNSLSWAIIIFFTILGLALTLTPAKRTFEVKKDKE